MQRIRDVLRLYAAYTSVSLRGQMQYRASFIMIALGQFFVTGIEFLGIWALFARFGTLQNWTLPQIAFFYGMVNTSFSLADAFGRGFDMFHRQVKSGNFDRLLLRPRSLALQVASQELLLNRIGRLLQGLIVLIWALYALGIHWTIGKIVIILISLLSGIALFYGLFVLQATLSFWTVETLELMNILTYGGTEAGQYPLSIYRPGFQMFFTFIVPLACVNTIPYQQITGNSSAIGIISLISGFLFLVFSLQIWRIGVRHYTSTGS